MVLYMPDNECEVDEKEAVDVPFPECYALLWDVWSVRNARSANGVVVVAQARWDCDA